MEKHETVREGYQILLRAHAELLLPREKPKIRWFYEHLCDTCLKWAKEVHGERLRQELLRMESVRERAQVQTCRYQLRMHLAWEDARYAAILCESEQTGQWKIPQKGYHRISHVWDTEEELILPFSEILKKFDLHMPNGGLPFRPDGIYPEGQEMVFLRKVTDSHPFLEQRLRFDSGKNTKHL